MKKHSNIPIFIPELACPHQCVFCNQQKISGTIKSPSPKEITEIIEKYLATMSLDKIVEIAFFGGSFTGIPMDLQEQYLKIAYKYIQNKSISGIRLSTRPDYINQEILDLLKKYGVTTIELGAQSTNDKVLQKSGRGHNFESIKIASKLILENNFKLGLQMMIGLPEDSYKLAIQTAKDIVNLGATSTRIYPTLIIKDTALANLYNNGKYKALSIEKAVLWTKDIVKIFEDNNVKILRVGLHPSEELDYNKSLVAGPYHIAFNEMVMTEIWSDLLISRFKNLKVITSAPFSKQNIRRSVTKNTDIERSRNAEISDKNKAYFTSSKMMKIIEIQVNSQQLNYAIGYKQKNRLMLQKKGFKIKFVGVGNFEKYQIEIK